MKSLEHIIREIHEGKCCCEKKKDSLEHAIRKVARKEYESSYAAKDSKPVDEDVGGLAGSGTGGEPKLHAEDGKKKKEVDEAIGTLGTDKYQGNEFKSIRTATPHIKPPGPEHGHSQAPENASRQRSIAKEKAGINRVTEGVKQKFAEPIFKGVEDLLRVAPEAKLPAVISPKGVPAKPKTGVPSKVEPKTGLPAAEPKPEVKTKVETEPKVDTKAPVETPSKTKPAELPAVEPKVSTKEKPAEIPAVEPKVSAKEKPAELPAAEPKTEIPKVVPPGGKLGKLAPFVPLVFGALGAGQPTKDYFDYRSKKVPVGSKASYAHRPMKEEVADKIRKKIENMPRKDSGDRKSIEYVGRSDADPKTAKEKTSRLATIKNVIDEAKKIKYETESGKEKKIIYPNGTEVVVGPDMKHNVLDVADQKLPKDYENK